MQVPFLLTSRTFEAFSKQTLFPEAILAAVSARNVKKNLSTFIQISNPVHKVTPQGTHVMPNNPPNENLF